MSVYKKLMEARIKLQAMELKKSGHNKFAGYQYFELGDFLPQTMQIFNDLGLCGVVAFSSTDATLTITDVDGGGAIVIPSPMASASLKGCHEIQNLGASQTYLRRYLWVAAMEIVEHDVLDATTGKDEKKPAHSVPKDKWDEMTESKKRELQGIADEVRSKMENQDMESALVILSTITDVDEKTALWSRFDSKERAAIKKASQTKE